MMQKIEQLLAQIYADHGTHVCGIISSNHNQFSIAGVAPGLSIMEVSHSMSLISTIPEDLAAGINWAVQNGADVLSNSWVTKEAPTLTIMICIVHY